MARDREMVGVMHRAEHHREDRRHIGDHEENRMDMQEGAHSREVRRRRMEEDILEEEEAHRMEMNMVVDQVDGETIVHRQSQMDGSREMKRLRRHNHNHPQADIRMLERTRIIIQALRQTAIIQAVTMHRRHLDQSQSVLDLLAGREQEKRQDARRKSAREQQNCSAKRKKPNVNCVLRKKRQSAS